MQYCQILYYEIVTFDSSIFLFLLCDTYSLRTRHYRLHTKLTCIQANDCTEMKLSHIKFDMNIIDHIVHFVLIIDLPAIKNLLHNLKKISTICKMQKSTCSNKSKSKCQRFKSNLQDNSSELMWGKNYLVGKAFF